MAKSTVETYRVRPSTPPSPTWRTFLTNHAKDLVSIDFFTVATVRFEILYVLIILAHDRRRVRHFKVTAHPTAEWTAQQVVEALPWETAPRYLLRDRDGVYGVDFRTRVRALGIEEVLSAPHSPWQSPYVERVIGSIRRECLANVVVLHRQQLHRILTAYFAHYGAVTRRSPWTALSRDRSNHASRAQWWRSVQAAVSIGTTSATPPDASCARVSSRPRRITPPPPSDSRAAPWNCERHVEAREPCGATPRSIALRHRLVWRLAP